MGNEQDNKANEEAAKKAAEERAKELEEIRKIAEEDRGIGTFSKHHKKDDGKK